MNGSQKLSPVGWGTYCKWIVDHLGGNPGLSYWWSQAGIIVIKRALHRHDH